MLKEFASEGLEELGQCNWSLRYSSFEADLRVELEADLLSSLFDAGLCLSFLPDAFGALNDELAEQKVK